MKAVARAPGKIILAGEHFVVYGSFAVASSIDLYVTVTAEFHKEPYIVSEDLGIKEPIDQTSHVLRPIAISIAPLIKGEKVVLKIKSDIPLSAGLGSSAAVNVAAVKAIDELLELKMKSDEIYEAAMRGEKLIHEKPSGIDVAISLFGGFLLFKKGYRKQVCLGKNMEFMLCNTGLQRSTGQMIKRVASFASKNYKLFSKMVEVVSTISVNLVRYLERGEMERIGYLMNMNHEMLRVIGASNSILDRIVYGSRPFCFGSKLTGAGGGGCTIHLVKRERTKDLNSFLSKTCYKSMFVKAGVEGVKSWKIRN